MIEIVPDRNSFTGSYNLPVSVDLMTYLYMYNEVFVEEWNKYIKRANAEPSFIKSKWLRENCEAHNSGDLETHSEEEMVEMARGFSNLAESRKGKKGRYFEKLVDDFDSDRELITCYKTKFYTYELSKFADHVSVYQIEENEISDILNYLYLRIKKSKPFMRLVDQVMNQEPYRSASRVFWIVDNGSSHRGKSSIERLQKAWPQAILVHLPVHASWLNQIEIYFSIVQRKVLTPNHFESLAELEDRLMNFQDYYEKLAEPFKWKFTRQDLANLMKKFDQCANQKIAA